MKPSALTVLLGLTMSDEKDVRTHCSECGEPIYEQESIGQHLEQNPECVDSINGGENDGELAYTPSLWRAD